MGILNLLLDRGETGDAARALVIGVALLVWIGVALLVWIGWRIFADRAEPEEG